jgi:tetratricopeptide (TPR) repeat protein
VKELTVASLDPANFLYYYKRGKERLDKKDYNEAIKDFNEAIRLDANYAAAYNDRGIAWLRKNDYDEAIKDFDQAMRLDSNYAAELTLGSGKTARTLGLPFSPESAFTFFMVRGIGWHGKQDYEKALRDFDEAIRLNPTEGLLFLHRGKAWLKKKQYDKAIEDFNEGMRLCPNYGFYVFRGIAWLGKTDFGKAIGDFDESVRLDSEDLREILMDKLKLGITTVTNKERDFIKRRYGLREG